VQQCSTKNSPDHEFKDAGSVDCSAELIGKSISDNPGRSTTILRKSLSPFQKSNPSLTLNQGQDLNISRFWLWATSNLSTNQIPTMPSNSWLNGWNCWCITRTCHFRICNDCNPNQSVVIITPSSSLHMPTRTSTSCLLPSAKDYHHVGFSITANVMALSTAITLHRIRSVSESCSWNHCSGSPMWRYPRL
jgi:hypothetical protein